MMRERIVGRISRCSKLVEEKISNIHALRPRSIYFAILNESLDIHLMSADSPIVQRSSVCSPCGSDCLSVISWTKFSLYVSSLIVDAVEMEKS